MAMHGVPYCRICAETMYRKPVKDHYCDWQCYATSLEDKINEAVTELKGIKMNNWILNDIAEVIKELQKDGE